jgi:hypothetical protein
MIVRGARSPVRSFSTVARLQLERAGIAPTAGGGTFVVEYFTRRVGDEIEAWYRAIPEVG